MTGVAVNVTFVPEHIVIGVLRLIETDGITDGLTVMVIVLLGTGTFRMQVALLVISQTIVLPLVRALFE